MMTNEYELYQKIKENFLAERTKSEVTLADWLEKVKGAPEEVRQKMALPEQLFTAEVPLAVILPALYESEVDPAKYEAQYSEWQVIQERVNSVVADYNEEAKRCLLEFQRMS